jgi:DNA repair protein RecN (Recombination protein N)
MIQQITIKNFAIIDDLVIDFKKDMNIFTGETGAGKSIIIDALGLLTGERANASMVRHGSSKAMVEGVFSLSSEAVKDFELEDYVEDGQLIIRKEIDTDGRSIIKLNGKTTSISTIKTITSNIIDIHSQQDNQYLLNKNYHLLLLDNYGKNELKDTKEEYAKVYKEYQNSLKELDNLKKIMVDDKRLEFMKFEVEEIEAAKLKENELEDLTLEQKRIQEYENLNSKYKVIEEVFSGENNVIGQLYTAKKALDSLAKDPVFNKFLAPYDNAYIQMDEVFKDIKNEFEKIAVDEFRLNEIQTRIYEITKLKRKYGQTTNDILMYRDKLAETIKDLENVELNISKINFKIESSLKQLRAIGSKLEILRDKVFKQLGQEVKVQLKDLFLENAEIGLSKTNKESPDKNGLIDYEFIVSLNPGSPLKPLIKVASGGEMGRLMLGLKVIFNKHFNISTSIFDEIDVGISGKIARAVGLKMQTLAESMQIIVITHIPQVASLGKNHFIVEKKIANNNTSTEVRILNSKERIVEIAKMVSGGKVPTESALANAKELINEQTNN